jgi:UDP-N-acetylmuramoyl-tripeptide--D-alanyl-D-alanine ligase
VTRPELALNMLTLAYLLKVLTGRDWPGADLPITQVVIDSRLAGPGALFVALPGETTDGHLYVTDAKNRGALAALVRGDWADESGRGGSQTRPYEAAEGNEPGGGEQPLAPTPGGPGRPYVTVDLRGGGPAEGGLPEAPAYCLRVDDPLAAMQRVAAEWRSTFPEVQVVGVTGSVGKTTTKELIAAVLQTRFSTLKSEGNLNNEIGLPLSLLRLDETHERAVLEMGFYVPGEIALLCELARPQVGVVTNVLPVHVERAGSLEAVAQGKAELVEALPPDGAAILNYDDPLVIDMARRTRARVFTYGLDPRADLWASEVVGLGLEGIRFQLHHRRETLHVRVRHLGRHSVHTALRAAAVGVVEGLTWEEILAGLSSGAQLRLYAVSGPAGSILLDDTYNASPQSVIAALNLLKDLDGRKIAVLGDMLELGEYEAEGHQRVGRYVPETADVLITVGRLGAQIAVEAQLAGMAVEAVTVLPDTPAAIEHLRQVIRPGDVVLVKGSRGLRMDRIVTALEVV